MTDSPQRTAGAAPPIGWQAARIVVIAALLLVGFRLLLPAQFADPFVRHDDWLAMRPEPDLYYWKTLAKGRWVTWIWTLRPWPVEPVTVWWLYLATWCVGAAAIGVGLFRGERWGPGALLTAAAIAAMPQTADISTWYAATFPALLAVTAMALVGALGSPGVALRALFVLVPLGLMAHSSYPLMILMAAALAVDWSTRPRAWLTLPVAFLGALALGFAVIVALNWGVHGHLGIRAHAWMEESPARDLGSLLGNLGLAAGWLLRMLALMANGNALLGLALAGLAGLALGLALRAVPGRAAVVLGASVLAFGIGLAPTVLDGIDTPARATGQLWLIVTGAVALAAGHLASLSRRVIFLGTLAVMAAGGAIFWQQLYERFLPPYQEMSRALVSELRAVDPAPRTIVVVLGQVHGLPETRVLQFSHGLVFRIEAYTGAEVVLCTAQTVDALRFLDGSDAIEDNPEYAGWAGRAERRRGPCVQWIGTLEPWPVYPAPGAIAPLAPGVLGLRLPDRARRDVPP